MPTISFIEYTEKKPDLFTFSDDELELVHDPRLKVTWHSGGIWASEVIPDTFGGGYSQLVSWPNAGVCVEIVKELIQRYPGYYDDPNFRLLLQYERFGFVVPKTYIGDLLRSPGRFTYYVNGAWVDMYRVSLGAKHQLQSMGPVHSPENGVDIKFNIQFAAMFAPASLQELLSVVKNRRYTLFQYGIGVYAPGKTPVLHTNAEAGYVNHPEIGRVPAGLEYIDFAEWDGKYHEYTRRDLKKTSE